MFLVGCGESGSDGNGDNNDSNVSNSEVKVKAVVATGGGSSFVVFADGKVYATGSNWAGGLGLGDTDDRDTFTLVSSLSDKNITAIACGSGHSIALSSDGRVYGAGANFAGQLGLGDSGEGEYKIHATFVEIADLSDKNITAIAAGVERTFALSSDGKAYATGNNDVGQLGLGEATELSYAFIIIPSLSDKNITAISAGWFHSLALDSDGKVYATGWNLEGQLGLGDSEEAAAESHKIFTEVPSFSDGKIIAITASLNHSLALSAAGKVYGAGENYVGQLGLGYDDSNYIYATFTEIGDLSDKNITAMSLGQGYSLALSSNGKVYGSGSNGRGGLGLGEATELSYAFIPISSLGGKNIVAIAANDAHSIALDSDGKIYATGGNSYGQLGLGNGGYGTERYVFTPVTVFNE